MDDAVTLTPAQRMVEQVRALTEAAGTFETDLARLTGDELAQVEAALAAVAGLQHAIDLQTNVRRLALTRRGRPARKAAAKQKGDAA
ncbi:MAG: hypothetical protein B7Y80_19355 [Hyphomicrobium sp. 32-62-53]|nr:MAG: hypothetical protein B7Z29_17850 [Hyphomicrobium sp. 12-62-95]OYX97577.1 MAG: hypothetical protein B7Y80_19355 [Hyphomicrobium sp. 32-62-53]